MFIRHEHGFQSWGGVHLVDFLDWKNFFARFARKHIFNTIDKNLEGVHLPESMGGTPTSTPHPLPLSVFSPDFGHYVFDRRPKKIFLINFFFLILIFF